jgi:nucleoside-diphosphate kinase
MAVTRTFSIIKPDATRRNLTGAVTKTLEEAGLRVVASKRVLLSREQAEGFYAVHKERPFFGDLVAFMTSGPVVVQVLEGEDAVKRNRDIMGATNPADADEGTIRKLFAESDRGQLGAWFGQRRERRDRDRLLLQARRNRRLIKPYRQHDKGSPSARPFIVSGSSHSGRCKFANHLIENVQHSV